jgi:alpha-D-xyloside xylohydrolase
VVYVRWLQFGVFSSHVRAHGKQPCEPWTCGTEVEEIAQRYLKLRYRLLPYIYSEAVRSSETGLPMVRPMVLAYQSDHNTHNLDLQYMFGESFLVAPVVSPLHRRQVYLPEGEWVDYWTKEVVRGGQWVEVEAGLETLPLWVRAGAIVPMGPEMAYVGEKPLDPLTLEIYKPSGEGELIVHDEGEPNISVRTRRRAERLDVEINGAECRIDVILYGVGTKAALRDGEALALNTHPGGRLVRFDATGTDRITLCLKDKA